MAIAAAFPSIVTDTITGYAPLTVHLHSDDVASANYFEWDFGDTGRTNASSEDDLSFDEDNDLWKTTTRESVFCYGNKDLTTTTVPERDIDLNTEQRSRTAAYTFYRPGTYTVTLREYNNATSSAVVDTITVVVEDPDPATYPAANATTNWTQVNINTDDETAGTDFATAIANANSRGGQMVIKFGGNTNYIKVDSGLTINCSDLVIKGTDDTRPTFCFTLDVGDVVRDGVDLLTISDTSQNIYIEGIRFRPYDVEGQSGSLNSNNYDPSSHTSIRGLVSAGDIGTTARGITLQYCDFWNFTKGVEIVGGSAFYGCNLVSNRHNQAAVKLGMDNVVISGALCATNQQTSPTQTMDNDYTSVPAYIYEIGDDSRTSINIAFQFNWLWYGGSANYEVYDDQYPADSTYNGSEDSGSFSGPLLFTQVNRGAVYRNALQRGTNTFARDCNDLTIARNSFEAGGMSACLEMGTGFAGSIIYSNVFLLASGRAQTYAMAILPTAGSETIDSVRICNNTFLFGKDISKNGGALFLRNSGIFVGQDAFNIKNNLFVDHHSYQAKVFDFSTNTATFSNNVYFDERPDVDFGKDTSTTYTYATWLSSVEPTASIERIEWRFMKKYWSYMPDPLKHSSLATGGDVETLIFEDLLGNRYDGTSYGKGAVQIDISNYDTGSTNPFAITANVIDRTDRLASGDLDINGVPISNNPGDNLQIIISDPDNDNFVITRDFTSSLFPMSGNNLQKVGEWIRTDITNLTVGDDYVAFDLTYINDGPVSQTLPFRDGFNSNYDTLTGEQQTEYEDHEFYFNYDNGDLDKISLGGIRLWSAALGDKFAVLQQYRGSGFSDVETRAANVSNLSNRTYPGNRYTPVSMALNHRYVVTGCVMWNIEEEEKGFSMWDNIGASSSSLGTVNNLVSWRDSYSITNPVTSSSTTGQTPYMLESGESFSLKIYLKVSRNSRYGHVQTMDRYKEFFDQTYGNSLEYTRDPRVLNGNVLQQSANLTFPSNVYGYAVSYRPDRNGWSGVRDAVLEQETNNGVERVIMWPPGGNYLVNQSGNFPFLMWSPFFDEGGRTVGEFTPTSPLPSGIDPSDIDGDYPGGSFDPYPVQAIFDELPLMQNLNFEYPSMGYYWGRATQIQRGWDSGDARYYDESVPYTRAEFMREFDFMANTFRARLVGMDAYRASRYGYLERDSEKNTQRRRYGSPAAPEIRLMKAMLQRWPHCKLGTELALPDVYHRLGAIFIFNDGTPLTDSTFVADYINPGHEYWSAFRYDLKTRHWGNRQDQDNNQRRYMMKQAAELGWTILNFSGVETTGTGYTPEDFLSTDRRFDFETQPSDGKKPSAPQRFAYVIGEGAPLFDANYVRLRWDASPENDIRFYRIEKARLVDGIPDEQQFMTIDYTDKTRYLDIASRDNDFYVYRVIAIDWDGNESDPSRFAIQRPPDGGENPRPRPIAARVISANSTVRVDWSVD